MFSRRPTHKAMDDAMPATAPTLTPPAGEAAPASFEEIYRAYADTTARWAQQLGGAGVDSDDIVQEVFIVVSRQLGRFRGDARLSTWLFEITRKIAANHRRRHRWRFWHAGRRHDADSEPSQRPAPDAELERRQTLEQLYRVLDQLPDKYRTVLVLYEIEGMSTQEIADLRQLNLSTVRVQLARARESFGKRYRVLLRRETS
jgi:RNA polymerase sigma-70 factor, ECF subfamily